MWKKEKRYKGVDEKRVKIRTATKAERKIGENGKRERRTRKRNKKKIHARQTKKNTTNKTRTMYKKER